MKNFRVEKADDKNRKLSPMPMLLLALVTFAAGLIMIQAFAVAPDRLSALNTKTTLYVKSEGVKGVNISGSCVGVTDYKCSQNGSFSAQLIAPRVHKDFEFARWVGCDSVSWDPKDPNKHNCYVSLDKGKTRIVTAVYVSKDATKARMFVSSSPQIVCINNSINTPTNQNCSSHLGQGTNTPYETNSDIQIVGTLQAPLFFYDELNNKWRFISWSGNCTNLPLFGNNICDIRVEKGAVGVLSANYQREKQLLVYGPQEGIEFDVTSRFDDPNDNRDWQQPYRVPYTTHAYYPDIFTSGTRAVLRARDEIEIQGRKQKFVGWSGNCAQLIYSNDLHECYLQSGYEALGGGNFVVGMNYAEQTQGSISVFSSPHDGVVVSNNRGLNCEPIQGFGHGINRTPCSIRANDLEQLTVEVQQTQVNGLEFEKWYGACLNPSAQTGDTKCDVLATKVAPTVIMANFASEKPFNVTSTPASKAPIYVSYCTSSCNGGWHETPFQLMLPPNSNAWLFADDQYTIKSGSVAVTYFFNSWVGCTSVVSLNTSCQIASSTFPTGGINANYEIHAL